MNMRFHGMRLTLALGGLLLLSGSLRAQVMFYRTNSDTFAGVTFSMTPYASLANLATGAITGDIADIAPDIPLSSQVFSDGTFYYKTVANGGVTNQVVRYASLDGLSTDTGGTIFNLTTGGNPATWNLADSFFSDGTYFYRNGSVDPVTPVVGRYDSFADMVSDTNPIYFDYAGGGYSLADRFFAVNGIFYRSLTSGGLVTGFAVYDTFEALRVNNASHVENSASLWGTADRFIAIAVVPEPSTCAFLAAGAAAIFVWRRRCTEES